MKNFYFIVSLVFTFNFAFTQGVDKELSDLERSKIIEFYQYCKYTQVDFDRDLIHDSIEIFNTELDRFAKMPAYIANVLKYRFIRLSDFRPYIHLPLTIPNLVNQIQLKSASVPDATVNHFAVIVGCDDYGGSLDLVGCAADAKNIYDALTQVYRFLPENVRLRTDEKNNSTDDVSSTSIYNDLDWLAQQADGNDVVLFFFSGHGSGSSTSTCSLVTQNGSLSQNGIKTRLDNIKAETSIVIMDACRSGGIKSNCAGPDNWLIAAAGADENSHTGDFSVNPAGISGSVFTSWFVDALTYYQSIGRSIINHISYPWPLYPITPDTDLNGFVSLTEAFKYAKKGTESLWTTFMGYSSHPEMSPTTGDIGIGKYYISKPDAVPPYISSIDYSSNNLNTNFTILFSETIDPATLSTTTIILQGNKTGNYSFTTNYDASTKSLIINPAQDFKNSEEVTLTLTTGIKDLSGNSLDGDKNGISGPNYNLIFTTTGYSHDYSVKSISLSNPNPVVGETVVVSGVIHNDGKVTESAGQPVNFYVDGKKVNSTQMLPSLATGQESTIKFNWIAIAGVHEFKDEVVLAGDENSSNNIKSTTVNVGTVGSLTVDGEANPIKDFTLSESKYVDPTIQLQNIGSAAITGNITKSGNVANWITLVGGTSFSLTNGQTMPYSYRITVPSATALGSYTASIIFTYEGGTKTNTLLLNINVVEVLSGVYPYTLNTGSVVIDGRWSKTQIVTNVVSGSTNFYLDNDKQTTYPTSAENAVCNVSVTDYNRMSSADWTTNFTEHSQSSSSSGIRLGISENSSKSNTIYSTLNGTTDIMSWIVRGSNNTFTCGLDNFQYDAANVKWYVNSSSAGLKFTTSGWGKDCNIPSTDLSRIKDGWNTGRIYFKVDAVATGGNLKLYNKGVLVSTTSISSSNVGSEKYFSISSSKTSTSNYYTIIGDPTTNTVATISNIRLEITYYSGDPNLVCTKSLSKNKILINETTDVSLLFQNIGSNISNNTKYNDSPLPAGLTLSSGDITKNLPDIAPGATTEPVIYTLKALTPGVYNFGSTIVNYENQSRSKSYKSTFNSVSLQVLGGTLLVSGQVIPNEILTGETTNISATITESLTNTSVPDAVVSCSVKNITKNILYPSFYLIYDATSKKYINSFNNTSDAGIYEIKINAQKQYFEEGNLSSAINCTVNNPPYIIVVPMSQSAGYQAGSVIYEVNSNVDWQINEQEDWLTCTKLNNSQLKVIYTDNNELSFRSGTITLTSSGISVSVTLSQENCHINAPEILTTQPTCTVATGTIKVTAPTGTGMTYSINGTTYTNTNGIFTSVQPGNYTVTAKNASGCTSPGTPVVISPQPATPKKPTISHKEGNILQSDAPTGNQWYNNNLPINGATNQEYIASPGGDYYVIVKINGCSSEPSEHIFDVGFEINEKKGLVRIYPNPVNNELVIEMKGNTKSTNFIILNSLGLMVYKGNIIEKTVVQTTSFNPDVYIIKLESGRTIKFIKIMKN